ncbi:Broad specificity phosphatase PhoE [Fibrobacter sp. UWB7]|nr:Broad specificity phosphatase PhoE [Fibrobacter sp. UWB7]
MRVWILALSFLFWTSCDSVRYGSVPCEGDDCEASLDMGSSDSKENSSNRSSSSKNPSKNTPDQKDTLDNKDKPNVPDTVEVVDTTAVADAKSLPACNSSNEGESFMVTGEDALYFCIAGNWEKNVQELFDVTCSDGTLKLEESVAVADSVDAADYRRAGVAVTGFAEKGPFRYGTSVKIVELDSVMRLADSKRTHQTCITSSNGKFDFGSVNLVSPYVRVEANGFYKDELTGGLSSSLIKLNAVVDLSKRDSFNVNMLTHMAAPRVLKLVQDAGNNQPIGSQSGRALSDVLSSFGISLGGSSSTGGFSFGGWNRGTQTTSTSKSAEDLTIFGDDDYSAALLAVSVMMQSFGSVKDMLQFADFVAADIRGDGNWGDNASKAKLADKLLILDAEGGLAKIRKNMESWKLGDVPDFEKHVRNFWTSTHGFESCNAMTNGMVKHVGNSQSEYFVSYYEQPEGPRIRFICDGSIKAWRVATDLEKDTVGFGAGDYDGQIKNGKINVDKFYVYEQSKKSWRAATSDDIQEFVDVDDVMKKLAPGEKVIFVLRHAERTDDTGKKGHLTDNGKKQSQSVGAKLKGENIYFANSTYTRSYETCENVATGAGITSMGNDTLPELDGDWFVKDESKFETYKNGNGGGWVVASEYAYKGSYSDAYYPLQSRGEEFMTEIVKPRFAKVNRVGVWISHDMMVVPLTAFCTNGKANLRYFDTKQWINYLAGVAIILGTDGTLRYEPVKGLSSGTMTM